MLELIPIKRTFEENAAFAANAGCLDILRMSIDFYKRIGFVFPWIGYFAVADGNIVGSAGYKGQPVNNKIEIAYGTNPGFQHQGIGTEICRQLVVLAHTTDPNLMITARTLPQENYSTKILQKNGFNLLGMVWDKDDGNVWEWRFEGHNPY
ncbi:MAG TPA: GNAT family N-acetyltransferase [Agriterribacter sp.]|nr:GNAT family N-acetyltransferase [Agriterribacter sp.]